MALLLLTQAGLWATTGTLHIVGVQPLPLRVESALPFVLAVAFFNLVIAAGMVFLKSWAWVAAMTLQGVALAGALWSYFEGEPNYAAMALSVFVVFYLNLREVRRPFGVEDLRARDRDDRR
ncbi:MAG: hypothetical protein M5U22_20050 [Thermoleophilia bacterium]|nr:hypothetical protein [Thermoleophilia bacterium]